MTAPESRDAQSGVEEVLRAVVDRIEREGIDEEIPGSPGWCHAYAEALAAALGPVIAKAWDEGYAQAEKDFVHSDYCGTRCQCDPNLTSGAGNPYRADREQP